MINAVDVIYLFFVLVTLYFTFLVLLLFIKNRRDLYITSGKLTAIPSVSLVVPAHNEARVIRRTLGALEKLDYPKDKMEILVIDDGSTDRTAKIARSLAKEASKKIKVFSKSQGGKASALNFALKKAKSEIFVCVDADSLPEQDALLKTIPYFKGKKVGSVTTQIFVARPRNLLERLQRIEYALIAWARKMFEFINSIYVAPGPFALYKKSLLLKLGGFDEKNLTEDIEIAWRILYSGHLTKMSDARVYTQTPQRLGDWWRQRVRWNVGGIQTVGKYREAFFKKKFGMLGMFVLPFFSFSYILSLLGISILLYLVLGWLVNTAAFTVTGYAIGLNPARHFSLFFIPDIFTIFGLTILALSLIYIGTGLKHIKERTRGIKGAIDMLLYLTIYITLFPFILIHSILRVVRKKLTW